jgi:hypothetical protein
MRCFALALLAVTPAVLGQTVVVKDGNVTYVTKDGRNTQITSAGLDSDARLSLDQKLVVFVRRTPTLKIDTGTGEADLNELWIADTAGKEPPKRVLTGHSGGFTIGDNLVLAGFRQPQFSPDGTRIYFAAQTWATTDSFRMLDLNAGRVHFLFAGYSLEVLKTGHYAGPLRSLDTGFWTQTERKLGRLAKAQILLKNSSALPQ